MIDLIFDILPQIHGGGDHGGMGAVKGLEAFLTFIESLGSKSPAEIFAAFMPGIAAIDNIHPLLVHFPIALLTVFFFADTLGGLLNKPAWRKFATPTLYLGTLSALLTVAAGLQAAYSAPHNDATHAIMLRHQAFGISVTVLALILSLRRFFAAADFIHTKTYGHFALSGLLLLCLAFGADLGALMVYQHGVAVAPVIQQNRPVQNAVPTPHSHHDETQAHTHAHPEPEPAMPHEHTEGHDHQHEMPHTHDHEHPAH